MNAWDEIAELLDAHEDATHYDQDASEYRCRLCGWEQHGFPDPEDRAGWIEPGHQEFFLAIYLSSKQAEAWTQGFEDGADVERNGYWINGKHATMPNPYLRDDRRSPRVIDNLTPLEVVITREGSPNGCTFRLLGGEDDSAAAPE